MTRILHLSDTHMTASGKDMDGVHALAALDQLLHDVRNVPDLDAVVVTGDVADDGTEEGCRLVRDRIAAFAAPRGIPHLYSTGNHDACLPFRAALGSGHVGADGHDVGTLLDPSFCAAVSHVGGLRVVTLDSLVPGSTHGFLDDRQLEHLARLLDSPAADGTVLALHHPPLHLATVPNVARVVLQNIADLAAVVSGSDVRAILAGHLHFQLSGSLAGAPVWVTPGVVTRIDTTAPHALVRGVLGAAATVIELPADGPPTFHLLHARDPRAGEQVYLYDAASGADVAQES